jgi:NAD(P)-dependent dehydrogenase (short-subunit alcohol dehydrogenase family)
VQHVNDVSDKVIIITGANSGAGIELAIKFAKYNAKTIIVACRNEYRALAAIATIKKEVPQSKTYLEFIKIDLADILSVKDFVSKV